MLSAAEARKQIESTISKTTELELKIAEESITNAIEQGYMKCWCYTYLHKQAIDILTNKYGYKVINCCSRIDGDMFRIEW